MGPAFAVSLTLSPTPSPSLPLLQPHSHLCPWAHALPNPQTPTTHVPGWPSVPGAPTAPSPSVAASAMSQRLAGSKGNAPGDQFMLGLEQA